MAELTFVPMDDAGFQVFAAWWHADEETQSRLSPPRPEWRGYLCGTPGVYAWMVYDGATPVAFLQLDTDDAGMGYAGYGVNPALRRRGYGTRALRMLLARPEVARLRQVLVTAEPANAASQRCAAGAGFVLECPDVDRDGMLRYLYTVPR